MFTVIVILKEKDKNFCVRNVMKIHNSEGYFVLETEKEDYYFNWFTDNVSSVFITNKEL